MAPGVALSAVRRLSKPGVVLDPMCGSGTTIDAALRAGHTGVGFDLDPLAVLLTRVTTARVSGDTVRQLGRFVAHEARSFNLADVYLPWVDDDDETTAFIGYWFGRRQQTALRKLAFVLQDLRGPASDALRVALSKLIITKDSGASLARDVSHSRPHRTIDSSGYDVMRNFELSVGRVATYLDARSHSGKAKVRRGDARMLPASLNGTVDLVVTSPPYLNAIDYLRGHRLSLVWLGYSIPELREVRSTSIGAERAPDREAPQKARTLVESHIDVDKLPAKTSAMLDRYVLDAFALTRQIKRVLKRRTGRAVLVVGDSWLRDVFIPNSKILASAAGDSGLVVTKRRTRTLPANRRYLPPPAQGSSALANRMRNEVILSISAS